MTSPLSTARLAGLLYLVMSALMVFGYMYVPPHFIVAGNAAATVQRIAADLPLYRFSILTSLTAQLLFVFVVLTLYELFKNVDRWLARIMVALVLVGVAAELGVIACRMAPLTFLDSADLSPALGKAQLDALAMAQLRLGGNLGRLIGMIWGLWLFPFGILVMRSRLFPRVLGVLLLLAGTGYMVTCTAFIVAPDQLAAVTRVVFPLYFGELPIILWMLIMGARSPAPAAGLAAGS